MKKISVLLLGFLLITSALFAGTVEKFFTYGTTSEVNSINLNGNIDNIITVLNGDIDNTNVNTTDGYRLYEVLGVLPVAGTVGRTVFYTVDKTLNFDTGSEWYSAITLLRPPAQGDIVYYNGTNWVVLTTGTKGKSLTTGGASANPSWEGMTTQGDIEYHDGTNRAKLGAGTAGQYLKTGGIGANPSWTDPTGIPSNMQAFVGDGTWTRPSTTNKVFVRVWGGGGGGGGNVGGGGGGGEYSEGLIVVSGNVSVVVGAGGAGAAGAATSGENSSFAGDTTISANGGSGANGSTAGAGGTGGSGGSFVLTGDAGIAGYNGANVDVGGRGGSSPCGGTGGRGAVADNAGVLAGDSGLIPGAGGGGSTGNTAGGNGADGLVIVYWIQ